jgi:hypothetical protein
MGDIILPEFQRPFVWKRKQILELLDSIFKNYPIGSMLVWESSQKLASKRTIADLEVGERSASYPVNYLLDGQQRLSTICGVLHWEPGNPRSVWNVIFDLKTEKFSHVDHINELPLTQVPLRRLSDPADYFRQLSPLEDRTLRNRADVLFNRFKDYHVPLVTLGDMSINDVAPVFERINSTGTRLTIYDLMRAATWSPEFDLGKNIDKIRLALEPKRFDSLDNKTFLRALGAAAGGDFSKESIDALRNRSAEQLRQAVEATTEAAKRAADFLTTEIGAPRSESLPYANQFAVLCEIFRLLPRPDTKQLGTIRRWFWRTTLSGYFAGWDNGQMASDAKTIRGFAAGKTQELYVATLTHSSSLWHVKVFRFNSGVSKLLALMLAHHRPVDLINGQNIDIDKSLAWSNDKEYHHFFPKAFLSRRKSKGQANVVANIVLLTSKSNIEISDRAPSEYLRDLIDQEGKEEIERRLATNLVPEEALYAALQDDYESFLTLRSQHLHQKAEELTGLFSRPPGPFGPEAEPDVDPEEFDDSDVDPTE